MKSLKVDDIELIEVSYEGEPVWSCSECKILKNQILNLEQKQTGTTKEIEKMKKEKERENAFIAAGEIISTLYDKMLSHAWKNGLPSYVNLGAFLKCSEKGDYKELFDATLEHLGVSLADFNSLRAIKQLRNSAFHSYNDNESSMAVLKSTTVPGFTNFIEIVSKYPVVFDITNSTCTEVDDESKL